MVKAHKRNKKLDHPMIVWRWQKRLCARAEDRYKWRLSIDRHYFVVLNFQGNKIYRQDFLAFYSRGLALILIDVTGRSRNGSSWRGDQVEVMCETDFVS